MWHILIIPSLSNKHLIDEIGLGEQGGKTNGLILTKVNKSEQCVEHSSSNMVFVRHFILPFDFSSRGASKGPFCICAESFIPSYQRSPG